MVRNKWNSISGTESSYIHQSVSDFSKYILNIEIVFLMQSKSHSVPKKAKHFESEYANHNIAVKFYKSLIVMKNVILSNS